MTDEGTETGIILSLQAVRIDFVLPTDVVNAISNKFFCSWRRQIRFLFDRRLHATTKGFLAQEKAFCDVIKVKQTASGTLFCKKNDIGGG